MNIYALKDEYAKSCGAEDWHDNINGMSAKDVDEEIYYLFEFIKNKPPEIFEDYADKYPFLNELSERERSIIICMMYENKSPSQ